MSIRFVCVRCAKVYRARDEAAGGRFTCKNCGQALRIPEAPESHGKEALAQRPDPPEPEPPSEPADWHVQPPAERPPDALPDWLLAPPQTVAKAPGGVATE